MKTDRERERKWDMKCGGERERKNREHFHDTGKSKDTNIIDIFLFCVFVLFSCIGKKDNIDLMLGRPFF
jgi:hypothetical protein